MKNKSNVRKVKAWALIHPETPKEIEEEAFFSGGDCCCSDEPLSMAIYKNKHDAESNQKYHTYYDIVPIEISYTLPQPNKKK